MKSINQKLSENEEKIANYLKELKINNV